MNTKKVHKVSLFNFINLLRVFLIGIVLLPFQFFVPLSYATQPTVGSWTSLGFNNCTTWEQSVDPNNANILYVPSCQGIQKSVDAGTSWNVVSSTHGGYGPIVVDPTNSNVLYSGEGNGVWKSTDGGVNWTNTTAYLNPSCPGFNVSYLVMDPNNNNVLYSGNYQCGGVWKTTDGGTTWTDTSLGNDIARILVDPTNSNIVYASIAGTNLYKSTDGGANWTGYNTNKSNVRGIAMDPSDHNVLYVGTGNGVSKSTDGGVNWTFLSNGPQGNITSALITDPSVPNAVYAGDNNGVHMSTDGGASWSDINTGLPSVTIKYLLIPGLNPNPSVLYASTTNGMYVYGLTSSTSGQPPVVSPISVSTSLVQVNNSITASANFTDPDTSSTHIASWNWGDNLSRGTVTEANGSGSVSDSHTYTQAGVYTITLYVTNTSRGQGTATYQYMVVYDPSAGWVAGSKDFTSPAGAVTGNSGATGAATFGFQVKYANGAMEPSGKNVSLSFPTGNISFTSTSYQWLVVSGSKATFKANGTLNGTSGYTLLVSAIDQSATHNNGLIRFQIKDSNNNVVYDTQQGAGDDADPTTTVTKGQIAVH